MAIKCRICNKKLKRITWKHLRKHNMTTQEYRERFGVYYVTCNEAREKVARCDFKPYTRKQIIKKLRQYAKKQSPITLYWIKKYDPALVSQAEYVFGSYKKAIIESGLERKDIRDWSKEKVITELKKYHKQGVILRDTVIAKKDNRLYGAAARYFGSWGKAVEAIGLDYSKIVKPRKRDFPTLSSDLRKWSMEHGPLNSADMMNSDYNLLAATLNKFGSIEKAGKRLKLPYFYRHKRNGKVIRSDQPHEALD